MIVEVAAFLIIVGTLLVAAGYFIGEYKARKERGEFDDSEDYAGPGPGAHKDINPDAEELFDTGDGDSS